MNSEEDRPVGKISYEKPTAVDLGPAAPVVGASCAVGESFPDYCADVGNVNSGRCTWTGNSAGGGCNDGDSADSFCFNGSSGDPP